MFPLALSPTPPGNLLPLLQGPQPRIFFSLCLSPDNTGLGNVCLPQSGNSLRARLRPGSLALTSTENQDSLAPAAALLEVNDTPHCPLSETSCREDAGKDGSSSLGLTTFPLAAIEATLGLDCPQVRGLTDPRATSFCVQTHVGIIVSYGHNSWPGGWGISGIPSFFQETCLCSGRVSHPSLPRVGLSPGNIPRDPSLMTYCSSPHLHVASQPRKEAVPPGRPPHPSPKRAPPHQSTAPPEKAFILGWDLRAGWLVSPQIPGQAGCPQPLAISRHYFSSSAQKARGNQRRYNRERIQSSDLPHPTAFK